MKAVASLSMLWLAFHVVLLSTITEAKSSSGTKGVKYSNSQKRNRNLQSPSKKKKERQSLLPPQDRNGDRIPKQYKYSTSASRLEITARYNIDDETFEQDIDIGGGGSKSKKESSTTSTTSNLRVGDVGSGDGNRSGGRKVGKKGKRSHEEMTWSIEAASDGFQVRTHYRNNDRESGIKVKSSIHASTLRMVEFVKNDPNDDNEVYVDQQVVTEHHFQSWQAASFEGCMNIPSDNTTSGDETSYIDIDPTTTTATIPIPIPNNDNETTITSTEPEPEARTTAGFTPNTCTGIFSTHDGCLTVIARANLPSITADSTASFAMNPLATTSTYNTSSRMGSNNVVIDPDDVKFDYIFGDSCVVSNDSHGLAVIAKVSTDTRINTKEPPSPPPLIRPDNFASRTNNDTSGGGDIIIENPATGIATAVESDELEGVESSPEDNQGVALFLTWVNEVACKGFEEEPVVPIPTQEEDVIITNTTRGEGGDGDGNMVERTTDAALTVIGGGTNYISNFVDGNNDGTGDGDDENYLLIIDDTLEGDEEEEEEDTSSSTSSGAGLFSGTGRGSGVSSSSSNTATEIIGVADTNTTTNATAGVLVPDTTPATTTTTPGTLIDVLRRVLVHTYNEIDEQTGEEQENQKVIHWTITQKHTDRNCVWDPVIGTRVYEPPPQDEETGGVVVVGGTPGNQQAASITISKAYSTTTLGVFQIIIVTGGTIFAMLYSM